MASFSLAVSIGAAASLTFSSGGLNSPNNPYRVVDRIEQRIDAIVERFDDRFERETSLAERRLQVLIRSDADGLTIVAALQQAELRLGALAASTQQSITGLTVGGYNSLDRLESQSRRRPVAGRPDFDALRARLERASSRDLASIDLQLAQSVAALEEAANLGEEDIFESPTP